MPSSIIPHVRVQTDPFDLIAEMAAARQGRIDIGAIVTFTGTVRDMDGTLTALTLEHYPAMTEREINRIALDAAGRWPLAAIRIVHRYGRLEPGDDIVLVITAAAHRQAAFEAADFLMDYLKSRAPFWKSQETATGTHWVDARDSDARALKRWDA